MSPASILVIQISVMAMGLFTIHHSDSRQPRYRDLTVEYTGDGMRLRGFPATLKASLSFLEGGGYCLGK